MPRPAKWKNVCCLPDISRFGPLGAAVANNEVVEMSVEEYETIRLIDHEGFTQEECAEWMKVARTTVQGMYDRARKKLADCLVEGRVLKIEGGKYKLCIDAGGPCGRGMCKRHRNRGGTQNSPD
ncbi:MAG TPA: hypothetical protein DD727_03355 [Clostridiales bacterium]|nr:hypothetical protein [Clostridiales bacterium]